MAFISMHLQETVFHIRFGRNEESHYTLKLSPVEAQTGDTNMLAIVRDGLILEMCDRAEEHFPLFIATIDRPMGDSATDEELLEFFNDIVNQTAKAEWPTLLMTLPGLRGGVSGEKQDVGVLLIEVNDSPFVMASIANTIDMNDRLSCSKAVSIYGIDPMIASLVDHRFFANQMVTAMQSIAMAQSTKDQVAQKFMEEIENGGYYAN